MPREYQFPFELRHLVYFREVARFLHFRRAAESLNLAQPALSRQIAQLEESLGTPLFNRTRRKVELTPAGKLLLEKTEPLLRELQSASSEITALNKGETGRLHIAFTALAMATLVPKILRQFQKKFPHIHIELNESPTASQLAALRNGDIDCGFLHPDTTPFADLNTLLLLREKNGVLLPADHPLAKKQKLKLHDLADTPLILFPRANNPNFYDRILAAFAQARLTPNITKEVWPRLNAIGLVRAGLGATFITRSEFPHPPPDLIFRPLTSPAPESRLVLAWKKSPPPSPALKSFLSVAQK